MKRYVLCFSLLVCFFNSVILADVHPGYDLTVISKDDVAKFWLAKKIAKKFGYKEDEKNKAHININTFLFKQLRKLRISASNMSKMDTSKMIFFKTGINSPVYGHYFSFYDVPKGTTRYPLYIQ